MYTVKTLKKVILIATVSATVVLAGCATRPESISASTIAYEKYMNLTCNQLAVARSDARTDLVEVSNKQNTKANWDFATMFFVLIPASQISGDYEAEVVKVKGTVEAIETAQIIKKCE